MRVRLIFLYVVYLVINFLILKGLGIPGRGALGLFVFIGPLLVLIASWLILRESREGSFWVKILLSFLYPVVVGSLNYILITSIWASI